MNAEHHPLARKIRECWMTQEQVSSYLGISRVMFNRKISGKNEFTVTEMFRICDFLGIEAADIPKYFKGA